jgi:hypothetical protein
MSCGSIDYRAWWRGKIILGKVRRNGGILPQAVFAMSLNSLVGGKPAAAKWHFILPQWAHFAAGRRRAGRRRHK